MSIIITNIGPFDDPNPGGRRRYEVRLNKDLITTFEHNRADGLSACLLAASLAVEKERKQRMEQFWAAGSGLSSEHWLKKVASAHGVSVDALKGRRRTKSLSEARHVAIYMLREELKLSWPEIGKIFARGHTAAMWAYRSIIGKLEYDEKVQKMIKKLRSKPPP